MMGRGWWSAAASGLLAVSGFALAAAASETCAPEAGASHEVVRVIDGETILLDDGQEVRLMGALAPRPNTLTISADDWPPAREAARALEALVLNRTVTLRYEGRRRDRYGRVLAQLHLAGPEDAVWVQRHLVAAGYARAYALPGNAGCLGELVAAEDEARRAGGGLWSGSAFRVHAASEIAALLRLVGRFAVVEGRVVAVARTRQWTYLNFGADWREDFTVSLRTRLVDRSDGGEVRARALEGRAIRVRGWIERRNGPMIEVGTLDEIEVLEDVPGAAADAGRAGAPPENETAPR